MGLFWDVLQQVQISNRKKETGSLEERVAWLEEDLELTQQALYATLTKLEELTGEDLNQNQQIGS